MTKSQRHNAAGTSTVIVAHAPHIDITLFVPLLEKAEFLIAADGGANHLHTAGIRPHVIIGDLDSVDAATLTWLRQSSCQILQRPREKDETDLELALLLACQRQPQHIDILGATGGRLDHTFANIGMLSMDELAGCQVRLLDNSHELLLIRAGEQRDILGQPGDTVSLLPLGSSVSGVTIQGFYYPLQDATLFALDNSGGLHALEIELR